MCPACWERWLFVCLALLCAGRWRARGGGTEGKTITLSLGRHRVGLIRAPCQSNGRKPCGSALLAQCVAGLWLHGCLVGWFGKGCVSLWIGARRGHVCMCFRCAAPVRA